MLCRNTTVDGNLLTSNPAHAGAHTAPSSASDYGSASPGATTNPGMDDLFETSSGAIKLTLDVAKEVRDSRKAYPEVVEGGKELAKLALMHKGKKKVSWYLF